MPEHEQKVVVSEEAHSCAGEEIRQHSFRMGNLMKGVPTRENPDPMGYHIQLLLNTKLSDAEKKIGELQLGNQLLSETVAIQNGVDKPLHLEISRLSGLKRELETERDTLRTQIEKLKGEVVEWRHHYDVSATTVRELCDEVEKHKKDTERYNYLRQIITSNVWKELTGNYLNGSLDEAITAAIAQEAKEKVG